jgi:hypothetical protein
MRRRVFVSGLLSSFVALCASAAQADHAPAYVVPGRADVPVMINGYDASWGVVSGDWGLYRPGAGRIEVYPSPYVPPPYQRPVPRYFPSLGSAPGIGRYEVNPPAHRPLPPRAQPFHQSWGAQSDMGPVTDYAPSGPMVIAPTVEDFGRRRPPRSQPRPPHRR